MIELPKVVNVTRIPYEVKLPHGDFTQGCNSNIQAIHVTDKAAPPRKRQYLFWNVALLLMEAAGVSTSTYMRFYKQVGVVLNRFVVDNSFTWITEKKEPPATIWLNGIPYTVIKDDTGLIEARGHCGEICYDDLTIRYKPDMPPEITAYVVIHECTHGILFESFAGNLEERETLVEALAWQILYFLQDNDLSKFKPEGE